MIRDITYCWCDDCPLTDCERHLAQLQHIKGQKVYSASDFHNICYAYKLFAKGENDEAVAAALRNETGEWSPEIVEGEVYIKLSDILKFPIRYDNYDKKNGDITFVHGIESVIEYAECLPRYHKESEDK